MSTPAVPISATEQKAAEHIFGDRLPLAERYVEHLATSGIERGLIGPREVPRLWGRHVLNCAIMAELMPEGATLADVGSGAGLPGLTLAIARPDLRINLIEPLERRTIWLNEVIEDLGLENVEVLRARSEQLFDEVSVDIVTARAVSALKNLIGMCMPLANSSGELLALKGRSAADEIAAAGKELKKHKCAEPEILTVGADVLEEPSTVVRVRRR
ncbi:16S rRNA (guanine(527)-N(7))-methyltransferase RsmG [Micrococcoides hystricis]|uniref:Ribosomal RNA small subunit methyltransferase G n=1 Tax=Micrococcoides hystricis TaxID=1572761 RepID=A0ABV6PCD5_9MICC